MSNEIKMNLFDHIQLYLLGWYNRTDDPTNGYYFKCENNIHGIVHVLQNDSRFIMSVMGDRIVLVCPKCKGNQK